jgi:raffinose/stachyose/melibiose transport system permease protein
MVLVLAGLQGIPGLLRVSASLAGATPWQTTRMVILPLLGPTIRIWIFLSMIGSLQLFDLPWIMTNGGPANATTTMATYLIDKGFHSYEFGYGSAVAVILFLFCFIFAVLYQRFALRRDTEGSLTRMAG